MSVVIETTGQSEESNQHYCSMKTKTYLVKL